MPFFRAMIRDHRRLALLLAMLALCVKLLVPQGYMPGSAAGYKYLTVQICFDGLEHRTATLAIAMDDDTSRGDHGDVGGMAGGKCMFSALGMGALVGADAPLLTIALAFVLALGFAPVRALFRGAPTYLRPPLRGPPALA
ncbi:MAG: DUF2946 family protein [Sphingobium sp.]